MPTARYALSGATATERRGREYLMPWPSSKVRTSWILRWWSRPAVSTRVPVLSSAIDMTVCSEGAHA